jgi:outer membrane protein TolC
VGDDVADAAGTDEKDFFVTHGKEGGGCLFTGRIHDRIGVAGKQDAVACGVFFAFPLPRREAAVSLHAMSAIWSHTFSRQGLSSASVLLAVGVFLLLPACSHSSAPKAASAPVSWEESPVTVERIEISASPAVRFGSVGRSEAPPPGIAKPPPGFDPVLAQLLRAAATHSPRMMEQELNIAQNDAFRFRGWRQHLPYVTAGSTFGYYKLLRGDNRGNDEKLSGTYSLALRYPIFAWGAIDAEKDAARLRERAAMHGATIAWRELAASIRRDYYQAVILKNGIELQKKQIALEERRQLRTAAYTGTGQISSNEYLARSVAAREKEFLLEGQTTELEILLANLRATTGLDVLSVGDIPETVPVPDVDVAALEADLAAYNLPFNNDTAEARMASLQRQIFDEEITQANARILPNINLGASIAQSPVQTNTNRFEMQTILFAGVSAYWNLFDRDATQTTVRALKARQRLIDAQHRADKERRLVNLRTQIGQIRGAQRMLALRLEYLATARRNLESLRLRLGLNLVEPLAVEDAEMQVLILEKSIFNDRVSIARSYHQFRTGIEQDPAVSLYIVPQNE